MPPDVRHPRHVLRRGVQLRPAVVGLRRRGGHPGLQRLRGLRRVHRGVGRRRGELRGGHAYLPVGSIMVLPGCTFYGFTERNFGGQVYTYEAGTYPDGAAPLTGECANGFVSYKCRCLQKLVDCTPEDGKIKKLISRPVKNRILVVCLLYGTHSC